MTEGSILSQGVETVFLKQRSLHAGWVEDSVGVADYEGRWQLWGEAGVLLRVISMKALHLEITSRAATTKGRVPIYKHEHGVHLCRCLRQEATKHLIQVYKR